MAKSIQQLARRHGTYNVFADFVAMSSYAISNAVDRAQYEKREAEYMRTVKKYDQPGEANEFAHLLAMLTMELDRKPCDVLGSLFHELEIHNEHAGQFFTPWNLCQMMATMNMAGDGVKQIIDEKGFVTAHEPACGSGAMPIAIAMAMQHEGINYQQHLHVTAIDIDVRCVHMAYTQFSLLHIPAVVIHGNALTLEEWGRYYTPAHIMGGWNYRLNRVTYKGERSDPLAVAKAALELVDDAQPVEPVAEVYAEAAREIVAVKNNPVPSAKQNAKLGADIMPAGTQLRLF